MKFLTTKKAMRGSNVLRASYCSVQHLLANKRAIAYSAGVYGWACDYYELDGIIISTGYGPIGRALDYGFVNELEKKAEIIRYDHGLTYEEKNKKIDKLLTLLIAEFKRV